MKKTLITIGLLFLTAVVHAEKQEKKEKFCWQSSSQPNQICALLTKKQIDEKIEELKKKGGIFVFFYPDRLPKK